ncbi:MAG TPA: alpha-amylase family protein [Chthonomonadaceae bacterium]|nr:alpha-amylase family protein [Chthonomonadaceae bacterium]
MPRCESQPQETGARARTEEPPALLPLDLPLPAQPPLAARWLRQAIVLQPWGETQYAALTNVGDRPRRLREEFGFNALIVLPPAAHNAITEPPFHLTEAQFRTAIEAYKQAGYRLILYSGIMHCGHAPEWMRGQIGREHPDWSQRDPKGKPVMDYGAPWLCPNTGALDYTADYTLRIVKEYGADGVMLDNNEFFGTSDGWTCYCDACQRKFREYVTRRCGAEGVPRLFGVAASDIKIPTQEGPLYALWLYWRNRVWAEANERFRARLRQSYPRLLFFANTQYEFGNAMLASDLQYEHEDVLLSESRGLTSWHMSEKMLLGQALAVGRPLWNYIGTFEESDFTQLRPQEVVGPIIAASLAHGARPWIVYYGFHDEQGDYRARKEMSDLLRWYAAHADLFSGSRWATVGVVVSTRSRDIGKQNLIPAHLAALLRAGVPTAAIREEHLTPKALKRFRVLTLETAVCLDAETARTLADWVRAGGRLIAAPEAGTRDELGRPRPRSVLWQALGLAAPPVGETTVGRGRVVSAGADAFASRVADWEAADRFQFRPEAPVEVVAYRSPSRVRLHLVRHGPVSGPVVLALPPALRGRAGSARLYAPGLPEARPLTLDDSGRITLPETPVYSVLVLESGPPP